MKPRRGEVVIPLQPPGQGGAVPPDQHPSDYFAWSLFNVLVGYTACLGCLCFPAVVFSIKARDSKVLGDLEAARRHGDHAKVLNIICTVLMVLAVVVTVTTAIIMVIYTTT